MMAYCKWCEVHVNLTYSTNENDPGDSGWVRACGHDGFVTSVERMEKI